jgi:hypothetical protein
MGYLDNSGLYVKIGTEVAVPSTGGEYKTYGELREIELTLNLTAAAFPFGATNYIINDNVFFPKGVRIQEVETYVETAAAGATATLDVGLMQTDRTTVTSATAFLAGVTVASLTPAGTKAVVTAGGTFAGALIGTTTAQVNYITIRVNTASFTTGTVKVRIRYYRP